MIRRLRKRWLCWRYGICPVHGVLRPHGGYGDGTWAICPNCADENRGKAMHRNVIYEQERNAAVERLDRDWRA